MTLVLKADHLWGAEVRIGQHLSTEGGPGFQSTPGHRAGRSAGLRLQHSTLPWLEIPSVMRIWSILNGLMIRISQQLCHRERSLIPNGPPIVNVVKPDDRVWRYWVYLKYWTLNLKPLMVFYPKLYYSLQN